VYEKSLVLLLAIPMITTIIAICFILTTEIETAYIENLPLGIDMC